MNVVHNQKYITIISMYKIEQLYNNNISFTYLYFIIK